MSRALGVATSKADIDEGTINNAVIGGTTPAAGTFTNLTSTGNTALGNAVTDTIALYGVTPVAQRAGAAQVALTDSSGGTASDTIAAIEGTYTQATIRNAFASLAAKTNELRAALVALGAIKGSA